MQLSWDSWETVCAVCASGDYRGDLALHQYTRESGSGAFDSGLERQRLCSACYGLIRSALNAGTKRVRTDEQFPGMPARRASRLQADGCPVCWIPLDGDRFAAELLPGGSLFTAPIIRIGDRPARYSLCQGCLRWVRDVVDEESIGRWSRRRTAMEDGPPPTTPVHCFAIGFPAAEQKILRDTLTSLGHSCAKSTFLTADVGAGEALFLYADARTVAHTLSLGTLARTVVVTSIGNIEMALGLMRRGASDLLVSPLSRQQIIGALDRLSDPEAFAGRDAETGLPSYRPEPRFGLPCHLVAIEAPEEVRGLDAFLVLRRFLRGYDRIGLDSGSLLPVSVFCPAEHLPRVMGRMQGVLGDGFELRVLASIETAERNPEAAPQLSAPADHAAAESWLRKAS